jgi:wyosine [tRNA(Phe)-imidazoG37] synthetase (radical SAM superfamily)
VVEDNRRGTEEVSRRLVELAAIKPGPRVLDIATGIGEPTFYYESLPLLNSGKARSRSLCVVTNSRVTKS